MVVLGGGTVMNILLFAPASPGLVGELRQRVARVAADAKVELVHTLEVLVQRLRMGDPSIDLAILFAATRGILKQICGMRKLFGDARIVLVVADQEEETVALAHRLRPRYIDYLDGGYYHLVSVLRKMIDDTVHSCG